MFRSKSCGHGRTEVESQWRQRRFVGGQWDAGSRVLQRVLRVLSAPTTSAANPGGKQRREVERSGRGRSDIVDIIDNIDNIAIF
ncbi:hypothetical protein COP2_013682 [Malus domestica]